MRGLLHRPDRMARLLVGCVAGLLALGPVVAQEEAGDDAEAAGGSRTIEIAVDPAGGPLTLEEDLQAAAEAWREAGADGLELRIDEDADTLVRYGDPERLGPDTISLTLRRSEDAGLEVHLHPSLVGRHPGALAHVLGRLAGLEPGDTGVMDPALSEDGPASPTEADVAAWEDQAAFAPEDLNRDGVVDVYDLMLLGEAFGTRDVGAAEDLDGSGTVDDADLERLREAYQFLPPDPEGRPAGAPVPSETEDDDAPEGDGDGGGDAPEGDDDASSP